MRLNKKSAPEVGLLCRLSPELTLLYARQSTQDSTVNIRRTELFCSGLPSRLAVGCYSDIPHAGYHRKVDTDIEMIAHQPNIKLCIVMNLKVLGSTDKR